MGEKVLPADATEFTNTIKEFLSVAAKKSKQEHEDMEAIRAAKVARQNASKPTKSKNFDATAYDSMGSKEWDKKLKQAENSAAAAKASTDARKKRDQEPIPAHAKMDKYLDKY